jgi:hypothetical protein
MTGLMRLPVALALAAALLVALAAPARAAPAAPALPVTGTVINSNGLTGTFAGTWSGLDAAADPAGGLLLGGTLTGTAAIGEAEYPLTDQPFAAPVTLAVDAACTTLTLNFGQTPLGVQDLALALDPVVLALPAKLGARYCARGGPPDGGAAWLDKVLRLLP